MIRLTYQNSEDPVVIAIQHIVILQNLQGGTTIVLSTGESLNVKEELPQVLAMVRSQGGRVGG